MFSEDGGGWTPPKPSIDDELTSFIAGEKKLAIVLGVMGEIEYINLNVPASSADHMVLVEQKFPLYTDGKFRYGRHMFEAEGYTFDVAVIIEEATANKRHRWMGQWYGKHLQWTMRTR